MLKGASQFRLLTLLTVVVSTVPIVTAADTNTDFFENRIRPVLAQHCYNCHSQRAKTLQGGLFVDSLDGLFKGGDSGPAIIKGNADESPLISALRHDTFKMPPKGRLADKVIDDFRKWINTGAKIPASFQTNGSVTTATINWESALKHWAYQPLSEALPPVVTTKGWDTNNIDLYVLQKLEENGLSAPPLADPQTIIRRTFFDLIGLPPTPNELTHYRKLLEQPEGFPTLVDDLLASPHYGERWGRHWLDVARYSDSNGADENKPYPLAWRYRNYVIKQFNLDTPYDTFVHQQIAGDLLKSGSADQYNDHINATTFLALGVKIDAEQDPVKKRSDIIDEQIDTIGRTFLGVTVGCARCHDHKFDPFTTKDYYAMAGVMKSTQLMNISLKSAEQPILIARNQELTIERENLLKQYGERLGKAAQQNVDTYLPHVPTVIQWQNTQLDAELRIRLSETANTPWESVGQLGALNNSGKIQWIEAETFARGNFGVVTEGYGKDIGIISDRNGSGLQTFEHDISMPLAGIYQLDIRYAAATARPGKLYLNGTLIKENAIGEVTGGWNPENQKWHVSGRYQFQAGKNTLRFEVPNVMSHIDQIALAPVLSNPSSTREAEQYDRGNFSKIHQGYGEGIGITATSGSDELTFIEYDLKSFDEGEHLLQFRYAANASRPMKLLLDGELLNKRAFSEITGGWNPEHQKWVTEATVNLTKPLHTLRVEANNVSVHIDKLRFIPLATNSKLPSPEQIARSKNLNSAVLNRWVHTAQQATASYPEVASWLKKGGLSPTALSTTASDDIRKWLMAPARISELNETESDYITKIDAEISHNRERLEELSGVIAMAVREGEVSNMPIHIRGSHLQTGDVVKRRSPRLLTRSEGQPFSDQQSGRLELAEAITRSETPLAARVISNRIWRWHFGKPLVRSTENFGVSGATPSHPELLDYLASYLIKHNWSLKSLHRHITESSTYRIGFELNEIAASKDPDNRWYWRHTPKRLEAEAIRDALLAASGELDRAIGGAPFEGISTLSPSPQALMSNRMTYENSPRRSVYLPIVRTNVYKLLTLFDFPNPAFPTGNRHTTTLPTQAMFLMNSTWVSTISSAMSRRIISAEMEQAGQIQLAYELTYSRSATPEEMEEARNFINQYIQEGEGGKEDAWSAFCQLLFLSNEFIYIN